MKIKKKHRKNRMQNLHILIIAKQIRKNIKLMIIVKN